MAWLERIVIQDFRNISLQELRFCQKVNCISGGNGQGKTNLMDAIHYLSMTKSSFGASDRFNYRKGTSTFSLCGTYELDGKKTRISIKSSEGSAKTIFRDDKQYKKAADHIGLLPVVWISPSDSALVTDSGEERRRFLNAVLSQMDREYLDAVQRYTKLLQQRNSVLKDGQDADESLLEAIDLRMAPLAGVIYFKRQAFVESLRPLVRSFYESLSPGREKVDIIYQSDLAKGPMDSLLKANAQKDRALGYTLAGVQRDDLAFTMDSSPIRRVGSQGQQKSFLVALKFSQYEILKRTWCSPPILLLDDLFDKLDMDRTQRLLKIVSGSGFGQIFITDTNKVRLRGILDNLTRESTFHEAHAGTFSPASDEN